MTKVTNHTIRLGEDKEYIDILIRKYAVDGAFKNISKCIIHLIETGLMAKYPTGSNEKFMSLQDLAQHIKQPIRKVR